MPKKLPYGQSNFASMIESGYAYVDVWLHKRRGSYYIPIMKPFCLKE